MQVTAKAEYALRAATVLAATGPGPVKSETIAAAEGIPLRFLHNILAALTRGGILTSLRGADGGYELCRDAATITVADVIRAVEGPFAAGGGPDTPSPDTRGPETPGPASGVRRQTLRAVWAVLRANERAVLESVTLADLAAGRLPEMTSVGRAPSA
ncbi:MAG TPA: Rrf2 family transcriptional regulator [Acidimicrobiia bacterium]|nr:Rrf2 family transcriptional regulator [Acidimicrobiia bacterium]